MTTTIDIYETEKGFFLGDPDPTRSHKRRIEIKGKIKKDEIGKVWSNSRPSFNVDSRPTCVIEIENRIFELRQGVSFGRDFGNIFAVEIQD